MGLALNAEGMINMLAVNHLGLAGLFVKDGVGQ